MGFRFFRRMKVAPGVTLNFSKSGISTSLGVRGAKYTVGPRGTRRTVGLPGSGLFYTEENRWGSSKSRGGSRGASSPAPPEPENKLELGFFDRLLTPENEKELVAGCKAQVEGDADKALRHFRKATDLADGAFMAGFLLVNKKRYAEAEAILRKALTKQKNLGKFFDKYGVEIELALPITGEVIAHVRPCRRGLLLGLAEVLQTQGKNKEALTFLKKLHKDDSEDVLVKLSLAELVVEAKPESKKLAKQVVELVGNVENESSIHAGLMLYKAHALRTLGLLTAARDELTAALRRKKDRSDELLRALRYERG
ncbi:MAG: DUF4236 domain-containing protein, partial [Deltaproteobacteria bacterium]|nr:DUF4236 domain-containing protein [Deltaproteobacteria bacterium]